MRRLLLAAALGCVVTMPAKAADVCDEMTLEVAEAFVRSRLEQVALERRGQVDIMTVRAVRIERCSFAIVASVVYNLTPVDGTYLFYFADGTWNLRLTGS